MTGWNVSERAAALHREAVVCDMLLPWSNENVEYRDGVLERYAAAALSETFHPVIRRPPAAFRHIRSHAVARDRAAADRRPSCGVPRRMAETSMHGPRARRKRPAEAPGAAPRRGARRTAPPAFRVGPRRVLQCVAGSSDTTPTSRPAAVRRGEPTPHDRRA